MMNWIIAITFLLMSTFVPQPEADLECVGEYHLLWTFDDCKYCDDHNPRGTYYLFTCEIVTSKGVKTIKFVSNCVYAKGIIIPNPPIRHFIFLPLVVDAPDMILGEAPGGDT